MVGVERHSTRKVPNFSREEDEFLKRLIIGDEEIYQIVMSKNNSKEFIIAKNKIWKQVQAKFNASSFAVNNRPVHNLKLRWKNLRFAARRLGKGDEFELDPNAKVDNFGGTTTKIQLEREEKDSGNELDGQSEPDQPQQETEDRLHQRKSSFFKRRSVDNLQSTLKRLKAEKKEERGRSEGDSLRELLREKAELEVKLLRMRGENEKLEHQIKKSKLQAMDKLNALLDKKLSSNNTDNLIETPVLNINLLDL